VSRIGKRRASKLDAHASDIAAWFESERVPLASAQARLLERGVKVSLGRLSAWWGQEQQDRMRERILERVSSGAQLSGELEAAFREHAAPQIETLIKLLKVLVMQASVDGGTDPKLLMLVPQLMRPVLEELKVRQRDRELGLAEQRFQRETCELFLRWYNDQRASEVASSPASNSEKIERLGQLMFGEEWK